MEKRDHVWVMVARQRKKFEMDMQSRTVSKQKSSKDPTEGQIQEASLRVASFVP